MFTMEAANRSVCHRDTVAESSVGADLDIDWTPTRDLALVRHACNILSFASELIMKAFFDAFFFICSISPSS